MEKIMETKKTENAAPERNYLDDIGEIVTLAGDHNMSAEFFRLAAPHLQTVAAFLRVTETQAALFSLILEHSDDEAVSVGAIAKAVNCGRIQILKYMNDFEALEMKHLIKAEREAFSARERDTVAKLPSYHVSMAVIKAVRTGRPFRYNEYNGLSPEEFFFATRELLESRTESNLSASGLNVELYSLFTANKKSAFVQGLKTFDLGIKATVELLAFICAWIEEETENITLSDLRPLIGFVEVRRLERHFKMGDHKLVREGLIANGCEYGMADTETYTLTQKAKDTFPSDFHLQDKKNRPIKNLITAGSIPELELFYTPGVARRVGELTVLLREENFSMIKKRLAGRKMSAAFTILFQGPPGTGKTETAYQIARLTGRNLCLVDISETKSQWFGESEKRVKAVFDRYKAIVSGGGISPILFFNEADAVLGKRQELGDTRRGPAQTENAIQNIILQEMETLQGGILIATTNMISNFDKAFERRFLYKIEFEKPDLKARALIWRNRLPELAEEDAESISRRYDFSGGQIENIVRKQAIGAVLRDIPLTLDGIATLCEDELLEKAEKRIGFYTNEK
jgi:DNA polymerase III delta prime subunit